MRGAVRGLRLRWLSHPRAGITKKTTPEAAVAVPAEARIQHTNIRVPCMRLIIMSPAG